MSQRAPNPTTGTDRPPERPFPRVWQPAEDTRLRRLWKLGKSDPQIAAAMGRSPSSVEGRRRHLGLVRESAGQPSDAELMARAQLPPSAGRPDLFALWDQRNEALRERLRARGEIT